MVAVEAKRPVKTRWEKMKSWIIAQQKWMSKREKEGREEGKREAWKQGRDTSLTFISGTLINRNNVRVQCFHTLPKVQISTWCITRSVSQRSSSYPANCHFYILKLTILNNLEIITVTILIAHIDWLFINSFHSLNLDSSNFSPIEKQLYIK